MTLYYVTGNKKKFQEASEILGDIEWLNVDLEEIQSLDPKKIIEHKVSEALKHKKGHLIVEDVSFHMDCLNGLPGPLVKWFLESIGTVGLFELADRFKNYGAVSSVVVGYAMDDERIRFFEGAVNGTITKPIHDSKSSWDEIFIPDGYSKSFAEMSSEEKNRISHRGIALSKLKEFLNENPRSKPSNAL